MPSSSSKPLSKHSKPLAQPQFSPQLKTPSLSSHLAMVELKSRILSLLSKLSDRDTYQIAVDELEKLIGSLPPDGFPVLLSSLLQDPAIPAGESPAAVSGRNVSRRESVRLLSLLCASHAVAAAPHLYKIIVHIVRRLKDPTSDSSVREACRDAAGSLAALYLRSHANDACSSGGGGVSTTSTSVAGLFVKPLLDVMGEQNKTVQVGAAMCLAKVVECGGGEGGEVAFQKLCPRICKMLGGQSFVAKGALLSILSSLAQIDAISPQVMPTVLQCIRECFENSDWTARKSAADTLIVLASHSGHLIADETSQIIASLEACRFDKVKPVRDSIMESLQLWKKISGDSENNAPDDLIDRKVNESGDVEESFKNKQSNLSSKMLESVRDSSHSSSCTASETLSKGKDNSVEENAAVILKRRVPSLKDKELNPEFFQKLETRSSNDVSVEVVMPRRCDESSHILDEEDGGLAESDSRLLSNHGVPESQLKENHGHTGLSHHSPERRIRRNSNEQDLDYVIRDKWTERGFRPRDSKKSTFDTDERVELNQNDCFAHRESISRTDSVVENSGMNNKGNWLAIQRQLSQLERQQAHLMDMLQDFMGGSHDSLVTLENRVRGLERVVEEMAQDLSLSSVRRGGNMMMGIEGSPGRPSNKYNGLQDFYLKFGRGNDSRIPYAEKYLSSDGMVSGIRGRGAPWRSDSEGRDPFVYPALRNGVTSGRRGLVGSLVDGRFQKNESDTEEAGNRRAWGKGQGPFRLGEGPSARSVWQASKDEATLEAIRVAGDDNETSRVAARGPINELDAEITTCDNSSQERGPLWVSWARSVDSLHIGDVDSAYAEVLSTGDDALLVKLMERSGPVIDELSGDIASELLLAVGQFLLEQSFFDIALAWIQQLMDLVMENGADFLGIPVEVKREILLNLHEASSTMQWPENWEGASADQIMLQLASCWGINIRKLTR